jgi:hypothetical protein
MTGIELQRIGIIKRVLPRIQKYLHRHVTGKNQSWNGPGGSKKSQGYAHRTPMPQLILRA